MARVPYPEDLPQLIRLKYLTETGRWTKLSRRAVPVTTLLSETGGDPTQSLAWESLMKRYEVSDVLYAGLADKHGFWGWLDLWRTAGQGPFTAEEVRFVATIVRAVTPALRLSVARQFFPAGQTSSPTERHPKISGRLQADLPQQAVLTLNADMAVVGGTSSVAEWLGLLQAGPRPFQDVPAEVLNVAAQLLALEAGVDRHPAWSRVHLGSGQWAVLRASRMGSAGSEATPPLAVTIQACPPEARLDIFARSFGITPRQRELLDLAAAGFDTAAMATALGISAYTVQDQFKQIFDACGVHSRSALLAVALGTAP
jgi:DNA-binding CsgD family transcriptional regulator